MIKKLASCIRQYKRDSILAPLFIVGEGFMEVVIPLFMAGSSTAELTKAPCRRSCAMG